jgi:mannose-1-phosphate guanylyltransferase/mannose-6-phosphate isomerase
MIFSEGEEFTLCLNESTYIKKGKKHQLINDTNKPLEIIEIQTGIKLDEEDIVRYQDIYKRN